MYARCIQILPGIAYRIQDRIPAILKTMPTNASHIQDEFFMQRALKLAAKTIGLASPNPQVGCVLVREPRQGETPVIIGEGAHLYDHRDHAEIVALKQARKRRISTRGATAYVTLEPCSHHGRTPPCANALIEAGISRCVIATQDPNPQVSGQGIQRLRAANIEVTLGILQQQARDLNEAFAHFIQHKTPFVTLKAALSVDGKLAPPPASRFPNQPHWLTGPAARQQVQLLRHASDAVLTGIGTVLADDPQLTDRSGILGPQKLFRRRPLLRVVLDTHLRIPLTSQLVRSAEKARSSTSDLLILCGALASRAKAGALGSLGVEVEQVPDHAGRLSLPAVLSTTRRAQYPQPSPRVRLSPQRLLHPPKPRRQSRPLLRRNRTRQPGHPFRPGYPLSLSLFTVAHPSHPRHLWP